MRHPEITVKLTGTDGNAFAIIGKVEASLRDAGVPKVERQEFLDEAMKGDYDHLLQTAMAWVDVT